MIATVDKADILALLSYMAEFGFDLSKARDMVFSFATITPTGLSVVKSIPVLGKAQLMISVNPGPNGALRLKIESARILGAGFLVGIVRALAAKAIVKILSGYHQFFATGTDKDGNILLSRSDVFVNSTSFGDDTFTFDADCETTPSLDDILVAAPGG